MKCLGKFNWVKILRDEIPYHAKGLLIYFLRLVSRVAFRKGFACYCGYRNAVEAGSWVGGMVGLKSILEVKNRQEAIDLHKTLQRLDEYLPIDRKITFEMLEKAYEQTLWLRSHIIGIMYDMIDFGSATKRAVGEVSVPQTDSDKMVCLRIPEPLPGFKELTGTVEEHWTRMIREAIAQQAKIGIPYFEKAHVHIRITTPRGTNNRKVWDTSNRAINVIINNLKGIFFDDDDFEHMSCSIEACWGKIGITEVRICDHKSMKKCDIFK